MVYLPLKQKQFFGKGKIKINKEVKASVECDLKGAVSSRSTGHGIGMLVLD